MVCQVRYLSSAGIHRREITGITALERAFPPQWLLYASLQCFPRGEPPIEMDAMEKEFPKLLSIRNRSGTDYGGF